MAFAADFEILYDRLDEEIRFAPRPTPGLFANIIGSACSRIPILTKSGKATALDRLIESGAWTDAALALIELELPAWTFRRLVCEGGEWICSLSRQSNLPAAFDDTVDAVHEAMPLAILLAFLQARRVVAIPQAISVVPTVVPAAAELICCDNSHKRRRWCSSDSVYAPMRPL
jgi:hypothetical protein